MAEKPVPKLKSQNSGKRIGGLSPRTDLLTPRSRTNRFSAIPSQLDPVFQYPLPSFDDFLMEKQGFEYFRKVLSQAHAEDNLDCFMAIHEFRITPSKESCQRIWENWIHEDAEYQVNLTAVVYRQIKTLLKSGVCSKTMFDDVQAALRQMMIANYWLVWKMDSIFEEYIATKGKSPEKLREDWLEKNKKTKWLHVGKKAHHVHPYLNYVEEQGNTVVQSCLNRPFEKSELIGQTVKVYWPADKVTRVCQIQKWNAKVNMYSVRYYFDHKRYDEDLQTDWCFFYTSENFISELREAGFFALHDGIKYLYVTDVKTTEKK